MAGALLVRGRCVLLGRRSARARSHQGAWDMLGGHLEPGEDVEGALVRELREEAGIQALRWTRLGVAHAPGVELHVHAVVHWRGEPDCVGDEHDAFGWFDGAEAPWPQPLVDPRLRAWLDQASGVCGGISVEPS